MPAKESTTYSSPPINLTDKALMIRPKTSVWNRENVQAALRILSLSFSVTVGVLLIHLFLLPLVGIRESFLLFFPAIAFISWYMGQRAGWIIIILSSLVITYFLLRPTYSWLHPIAEIIQLMFFIAGALVINFFIEKSKHPAIVEKYLKREKEYQQLVLKLHRDYMIAKDEIRARDEFLSIASHELKTPLTSMLLQLQTVLHSVRNVSLANFSVENLLKMLDSAEQQSRRLSKMINDLLNVSLITTGKMDLEKESMDINKTVRDCVERFSEKSKKEGSPIRLHADGVIKGTWDKLRIEQAITNLLTNAIKYGSGKPVDVTVEKDEHIVRIIVKDQGIGIPQANQEKIFARFERAVAKRSFEGLGVGLYITQQIVEAHGGKITVESKEGKGSTFTISLPIKP
jgi:signal transduction histidine kinase